MDRPRESRQEPPGPDGQLLWIGFEHLPDGEAAYAVIRRVQNRAVQ